MIAPTRDAIYAELVAFLKLVIGGSPPVPIILGLGNRVPMPNVPFVAITTIGSHRLETNVDTDIDGFFNTPPEPGVTAAQQATRLDIQIDFYGPESNSWATMIGTLFRDEYGCDNLGPLCQPLYADDPIMSPLVTAENQYLERWTVTAAVQYNPVTTTAQTFSTTIDTKAINVDVEFPPS